MCFVFITLTLNKQRSYGIHVYTFFCSRKKIKKHHSYRDERDDFGLGSSQNSTTALVNMLCWFSLRPREEQ